MKPASMSPMPPTYEPIGPAPLSRGPLLRRLTCGLVAYAAFVLSVFAIEAHTRDRFSIPSKAEIARVNDNKARLAMELRRTNASEARDSWLPYEAFQVSSLLLALLLMVGAGYFCGRAVWRVSRTGRVFSIHLMAVAIGLSACLGLLAGVLPWVLAVQHYDRKVSSHDLAPTTPVPNKALQRTRLLPGSP